MNKYSLVDRVAHIERFCRNQYLLENYSINALVEYIVGGEQSGDFVVVPHGA